ncbi:hypothetical protein H0H81_012496 [Sphagnurus paluster]|uniref:PNPLA domain-containing protein n=1 Tax=Sphagnurus paluster TaxID=117069 RepID=A0A9P7K3M8_9AGAR|nr:hypothetical protein H0H81_012496 [Sphagnurus paluster]
MGSEKTWEKTEAEQTDNFLKDPRETDLFVNALLEKEVAKVGHGPRRKTSQLQHFIINHPDIPADHRVIVVDTPGFDNTEEDYRENLGRIAVWFAHSYSTDMKLAGVIYLQDITETRMLGTAWKNLDIFQKLWGNQATKNAVLVTTKWGYIDKDLGIAHEKQLRDGHWKRMCEKGSRMARLNSPEDDARKIVTSIVRRELPSRAALEIRRKLVDVGKFLAETEAGRYLSYKLDELLETQKSMAERLQREEKGDDVYQQIQQNDQEIQNTLKQIQKLKLSWTNINKGVKRELSARWENHASAGSIFKVSEKERCARSRRSSSASEVKNRDADARQISKLSEGSDDFTRVEAPPAHSTLRDFPTGSLRPDEIIPGERHPLKVMALDGGGVRGISSLYILQAIMAKVSPNKPDLKPCEYFDMIAGTSTGGLIAIMLGRLQMSIPECIEAYTSLASSIFSANAVQRGLNFAATGSLYRANDFEKAVKDLVKVRTGNENALMWDPKNKCKIFVTTTESQAITAVHQIRTYPVGVSDPFTNCEIWKAARATSAGPLYFPSITINDIELVDGGFGNNNPAPLLLAELAELGVVQPLHCFLSIGTGMQPITKIKKQLGGLRGSVKVPSYTFSLTKAAIDLATSSELGHQLAKSTVGENIYFRFNAGVKKGNDWMPMISLDDWKQMPELVEITKKYLLEETERIQKFDSLSRYPAADSYLTK